MMPLDAPAPPVRAAGRPRNAPTSSPPARRYAHYGRRRRGFSLLELIIVLAVTVVLTGLLLPALAGVRENLNRVICSSNLRQIGLAATMYYRNNRDRLPHTVVLDKDETQPGELMAAHRGMEPDAWDGLGFLYIEGYCSAPQCFYCPSHRGEHHYDVYENSWIHPRRGLKPIYTNYQYAGDVDWSNPDPKAPRLPRHLTEGVKLILATDGWRRRSDFNHQTGMNVLRGDGSVRWLEDHGETSLAAQVPQGMEDPDAYYRLWRLINDG